jgi:hypothetical protein
MAIETLELDDKGEVIGSHNSRNDVLDQIHDQNEKEKLEGGMIDDEGNPVTAFADEQKQVAKPDPEKQPEEEEVVLKIDGEDVRKTKSDVEAHGGVRTYQMELAAEKRLEEAKRILNEAKTIQKPADQQVQIETLKQPSEEELIEEIRMGTAESAAKAHRTLVTRYGASTEQIDARVRQTIDHQMAVQEFQKTYPEVWADEDLLSLAMRKEQVKRNSGDTRPPAALYKEIGEELRTKFGKTKTLDDKEARKGTITNIASAKVKTNAPEPERAPSPSDLIESMKRSRGQLV